MDLKGKGGKISSTKIRKPEIKRWHDAEGKKALRAQNGSFQRPLPGFFCRLCSTVAMEETLIQKRALFARKYHLYIQQKKCVGEKGEEKPLYFLAAGAYFGYIPHLFSLP